MEKNFNVGVKGLICSKYGYILLEKALDNGETFWDVPGGRINKNESFSDTLTRELREELPSIDDISIGSLEGAFRVSRDIRKDTGLVLLYYSVEATFTNDEVLFSDEHESLLFVTSKLEIPTENLNQTVHEILSRKLNN
jgi:ADP-ribose pyrophosphatase YjhB (NUDIX family)